MNTTKNPFAGTILAEVLGFEGDLKDIPENAKGKFLGEKEISEMTEAEKIILTLSLTRREEGSKILNQICGVDLKTVSDEEVKEKYEGMIAEKITPEQKEKLKTLRREEGTLDKIMWALIRGRLAGSGRYPSLGLRAGFKIVGGIDMDEMLGGDDMGLEGIGVTIIGMNLGGK